MSPREGSEALTALACTKERPAGLSYPPGLRAVDSCHDGMHSGGYIGAVAQGSLVFDLTVEMGNLRCRR